MTVFLIKAPWSPWVRLWPLHIVLCQSFFMPICKVRKVWLSLIAHSDYAFRLSCRRNWRIYGIFSHSRRVGNCIHSFDITTRIQNQISYIERHRRLLRGLRMAFSSTASWYADDLGRWCFPLAVDGFPIDNESTGGDLQTTWTEGANFPHRPSATDQCNGN